MVWSHWSPCSTTNTLKSAHLVDLAQWRFHWRIMEKSKAMNSEQLLSTDQSSFLDTKEAWLRFVLWTPLKSSDQEPRNRAIKRSRTIITDQDSWSWLQTLLRATRTWLPLVSWSAISVEGQGNVNVGGRFLEVNAAMSQISTHLLVWAQSKVQRPWALFHKTTVRAIAFTVR